MSTTPVYRICPLKDPRWAEFVDRHPGSSVFHTNHWLEALQRTYGYEILAYTSSAPGTGLSDGLVFCQVASWITGRRLVSLPFSDHCEPLTKTIANQHVFLSAIEQDLSRKDLRYVEIRAAQEVAGSPALSRATDSYCFHQLDLRPDLTTLFNNLHKSSTQRKVLRAKREGLTCECGQSRQLLDAFYDLLLITRRRHGVPPQPKKWFRNLIHSFGNALQIRVALKGSRPVAAILTLSHKNTIVFKYGCSDARFTSLGGTQILFWQAIQEAKRDGMQSFDLGRSDFDNPGLMTFKDRLGGVRSTLTYSRFSLSPPSDTFGGGAVKWTGHMARLLLPYLPAPVLRIVGGVLYRHVA